MPKYVLQSVPFRVSPPPKVPLPPPSPCPFFKLQAKLAAVAVRNTALHVRCVLRLEELRALAEASNSTPYTCSP